MECVYTAYIGFLSPNYFLKYFTWGLLLSVCGIYMESLLSWGEFSLCCPNRKEKPFGIHVSYIFNSDPGSITNTDEVNP